MSTNLKLSNQAVNIEANALAAEFNNGYLRIYTITQPATADTEITTQILLAELRFGNPAFAPAVAGVITANAITKDAAADATGTPTWFRCLKSDGTTKLLDASIGTENADIILNSVSISAGLEVSVTALTFTVVKS